MLRTGPVEWHPLAGNLLERFGEGGHGLLHKWVEMAAKHFSLLTERVELVDHRHIEDKLIEARERAVEAGHAKKHPDVGNAT